MFHVQTPEWETRSIHVPVAWPLLLADQLRPRQEDQRELLEKKRMKILDEKKYQLRLSGNVLERQSILLCVNSAALRICKYSKLYCKICYLSQHMNAGNGVNNRGKKRSDWTTPNSLTAVNVRSLCVQPTRPGQCRRKIECSKLLKKLIRITTSWIISYKTVAMASESFAFGERANDKKVGSACSLYLDTT